MSNFSVESKSQLVKLLAVENLTVQHQKTKTAKFDPKNRVLYLPIWQNMSGALYDLLGGHEVGHALYTPAAGWHDAAQSKGKAYKSFLNVIEDARIEKKVKRRYPGLRKSFVDGYKNLIERNFFEINGEDVDEMSFINRLNLYTKSGGSLGDNILGISFTDEEQKLLKKVEDVESWDDVLKVTEEVWNYSKDEQFEMAEQFFDSQSDSDYDFDGDNDSFGEDDFDGEEDESENEGSDSQGNQDGESDDESNSSKSKGKKESDSKDEETDEEAEINSLNRYKNSKPVYENFEPSCETDDSFRRNEKQLLDDSCKEYVYVVVPKVKSLDKIITPAKRVHEQITEYYATEGSHKEFYDPEKSNRLFTEFKKKNDRYISLLAKEFEMRKAATRYAKSKISNTGDIDVNKIYKYQIDDSIFRKVMKVPNGKSHGLILLLDKSSSMHRNMYSSFEQVLVLASFCRKVNIPFLVYGFGNNDASRRVDFPDDNMSPKHTFSRNANEFVLDTCYLREYLSSSMSNVEWNHSVKNILLLMQGFTKGNYAVPHSEYLSNTPLIESVIAIEPIINNFKRKHNLDIINTVIVHDGDSDGINHICSDENENTTRKYFEPRSQNVFVVDKSIKFEMQIKVSNDPNYSDRYDALRKVMFEWLKRKTGTKIFGFFLIEGNTTQIRYAIERRYFTKKINDLRKASSYYNLKEECKLLAKELKTKKFLESENIGYDKFYLTPGGNDLKIDNEEFEVNGKVTANKLKTAFMKFNKTRQVNRVMVSKFIQGIAT